MPTDSDEFKGEYRKGPKTHVVRTPSGAVAQAKSYSSLTALLDALVPDASMRQKYPKLKGKEGALDKRVLEEQRNVRVTGWLLHTRKEDDDDYHLIVGSNASGSGNRFMTVEVSGLPPSGKDRALLKTVRSQFEAIVQRRIPSSKYATFSPPIKIRITGSLFFDGDHAAGSIGPAGHRPQTVWEIHPVAKIEAV